MNMQQFRGLDKNEKPLDVIVTDGGYTGIFRTIACIGDSLSSGEFESTDEMGKVCYHDVYDYSWGQYLARMAGCTVKNFSRGGMMAKTYCEGWAEQNGFWDKEGGHAQAYIIALGVNDILNQNMEVGTTADICRENSTKNKPTFAGYFGALVQHYKEIEPRAKFFFVTMPRYDADPVRDAKVEAHRALMYKMADFFGNAYVLDFTAYAPVYDREFKKEMFLGWHMNPCGYMFTARLVASYIDYIIRHNMEDFRQVGFIGTSLKRTPEVV